jgi:hypothetical protein
VNAPFGSPEKEPVLFGSTDDSGEGYFLVIGLAQTIFDVGVIVRGERDGLVLDNVLFNGEFEEQILLKGLRDSGTGGSMVLDGEMVRILSVLPQESKKPSFLNSKDLLEVFSFDFVP